MVIGGQEQWACLFLSTLLMRSASPNLVYLCCVFHLDICIYVFLFGYLFFWCWLVRFGERQGLITQPLHIFDTTFQPPTQMRQKLTNAKYDKISIITISPQRESLSTISRFQN